MLIQKLVPVLLSALSVFAVSASADSSVYVVAGQGLGPGQFGTVDLNTGAFQQIGPTEPDGYFGVASGPNGSLLSLTYAGNLDSINPATGVPTKIGPTGLGNCLVPSPACGPTSAFSLVGFGGKIYATDFQNDIYAVNPLTGAATLVSKNTGLPGTPFVLGSQNPDGTLNFADEALWGAGGRLYATYDAVVFDPNTFSESVVVAPELYGIDPTTGVATLIGPTDLAIGGAVDVNGTTYAFNDLTNDIETLNLTNGAYTVVGSFDPSAGVIQGSVPTPEPTAPGLVAAGIVIILVLRLPGVGTLLSRRRRRCATASCA